MKYNDFTFYIVFVAVDKKHPHFSFAQRTFCDLSKAVRVANKYGGVVLIVNTFKDGRIELLPFHE